MKWPAWWLLLVCGATLVAGCAGRREKVVWIDLDRVADARLSTSPLGKLNSMPQKLSRTGATLHASQRTYARIAAVAIAAHGSQQLAAQRRSARQTISDQRAVLTNQMLDLARKRVEARRPQIIEKHLAEFNDFNRRLRFANSGFASAVLAGYAPMAYSLRMTRLNLQLQRANPFPSPDLDRQIALVDEALAVYDALGVDTMDWIHAQTLALRTARRAEAEKRAEQEYQEELRREEASVLDSVGEAPSLKITLPTRPLAGAEVAPAEGMILPAVAANDAWFAGRGIVGAGMATSLANWRATFREQAREGAVAWCRRNGYALSNSPVGAADVTGRFIREWKRP